MKADEGRVCCPSRHKQLSNNFGRGHLRCVSVFPDWLPALSRLSLELLLFSIWRLLLSFNNIDIHLQSSPLLMCVLRQHDTTNLLNQALGVPNQVCSRVALHDSKPNQRRPQPDRSSYSESGVLWLVQNISVARDVLKPIPPYATIFTPTRLRFERVCVFCACHFAHELRCP